MQILRAPRRTPIRWPCVVDWSRPETRGLRALWIATGNGMVDVVKTRPYTPTGATVRATAGVPSLVVKADGEYMSMDPQYPVSSGEVYQECYLTWAVMLTPNASGSGAYAGVILGRGSGAHTWGLTRYSTVSQLTDGTYYSTNPLSFTDGKRALFGLRSRLTYNVTSTQRVQRLWISDGALTSTYATHSTNYITLRGVRLAQDSYSSARTFRGEYEWAADWRVPDTQSEVPTDESLIRLQTEGVSLILEEYGRRTYFIPEAPSSTIAPLAYHHARLRRMA